jgi:hypothetical protein
MNLTEVPLPSEQYSLCAGDAIFVWQFVLSGKAFCPVYESDRSRTYVQRSRVLLVACAMLNCLPGCPRIISTVPMVRNISHHSLYFCIRFLTGLIVALFSSNLTLFPDQINAHVLASGPMYSGGRLFKTRQDYRLS